MWCYQHKKAKKIKNMLIIIQFGIKINIKKKLHIAKELQRFV